VARLEAYTWPGNVRELRNAVARRIALGESAPLGATKPMADVVPGSTPPPPPTSVGDPIEDVLALELPLSHARARVVQELEGRYVARVLARYGGNVGRAAAASGIKRRYFQVLRARHTK
jgi:DNA-binding NtrC family response regulator